MGVWGVGEGTLPFSLSPSALPPPLFAPATQAKLKIKVCDSKYSVFHSLVPQRSVSIFQINKIICFWFVEGVVRPVDRDFMLTT